LRVTIESARGGAVSGRESMAELAGARLGTLERNGRAEAVVVVEVDRGSRAWTYGLRPGDVVVGVNRRKVRSVGELAQALRAVERPLVLNVVRGDFALSLVIRS
jgi:serine protease Do/serine protease DegQ